jgi:shikimate kinase
LSILARVTGKRTVWLVGMMGAGKSTVGPALARRLGRRFVDSDAEVERAAGRTISEIFAAEGEAAFRRRERTTIEALQGQEAVVSLGGGAVSQEGLCERLAEDGRLVYLRASIELLLERLGDCRKRPLLAGLDPAARRARLEALLDERRAAYQSAEIVVDTGRGPVDDVVEAVMARLNDPAGPQ